jgi:hypothetical protein
MYSDKFDTYYIAGAKLTWDIWIGNKPDAKKNSSHPEKND